MTTAGNADVLDGGSGNDVLFGEVGNDQLSGGIALSSSLLEFYLNGSDSAALGGDLAYQYAKNGNLSAFSMAPAQALLSSVQFGTANPTLQASTALQDQSPRLI